jgi:hypothetical protein
MSEVRITLKVPKELKGIVEEMRFLKLGEDKLKIYTVADIVREALLKGLRLMLVEREVFEKMLEGEAKEGASRIYASLVKSEEKEVVS